jgi:hypothetical protein
MPIYPIEVEIECDGCGDCMIVQPCGPGGRFIDEDLKDALADYGWIQIGPKFYCKDCQDLIEVKG